jgi:hypothetical protein
LLVKITILFEAKNFDSFSVINCSGTDKRYFFEFSIEFLIFMVPWGKFLPNPCLGNIKCFHAFKILFYGKFQESSKSSTKSRIQKNHLEKFNVKNFDKSISYINLKHLKYSRVKNA